MKVNNQNAYPLYAQIADDMRLNIQTEKWQEGERIPTEMELCDIYHVSRITVRKAIDELMKENLLIRERAKGTFVKKSFQEEENHFTIVKGFTRELQERGKHAKTVHIEVEVSHADKKLSKFLNCQVGDEILILKRIRGDEESVFAYFITYIVNNRDYSLEAKDYYASFYDYLNTKGISVNQKREYIEAIAPNRDIQKRLKIKEVDPVLKRVRFTSQVSQGFYEYTECFYIGNKYRYYLDLT
ncbi:GntR family transcriptional regulator [Sporosarcina sp. YIM B06819]|uniref:GntR family transcriptional regulator n=1 Tax=Sporosarcina sp. YIM B06819 TaxID=3081769 RepID=UPI00298D5798|nr:GntR family transcriptional regulator [Sporosarcina sp. YIM B06819]